MDAEGSGILEAGNFSPNPSAVTSISSHISSSPSCPHKIVPLPHRMTGLWKIKHCSATKLTQEMIIDYIKILSGKSASYLSLRFD